MPLLKSANTGTSTGEVRSCQTPNDSATKASNGSRNRPTRPAGPTRKTASRKCLLAPSRARPMDWKGQNQCGPMSSLDGRLPCEGTGSAIFLCFWGRPGCLGPYTARGFPNTFCRLFRPGKLGLALCLRQCYIDTAFVALVSPCSCQAVAGQTRGLFLCPPDLKPGITENS